MAKQVYKFSGKAAYVSRKSFTFKTDPNKPIWSMSFYPITAADRKAVSATGIKNKVQEDSGEKSGIEGFFYTFRSTSEYPIYGPDGQVLSEDILVGNGSDVEVSLEVETFNSPKFGPQARSKLLSVQVINLIPYVPKVETPVSGTSEELPA